MTRSPRSPTCRQAAARLAFWVALAVAPLVGCATTDPVPSSSEAAPVPISAEVVKGDLAQRIHAILSDAAQDGFGGSVVVADGDEVVLKVGYGWANKQSRVPFIPATVHQIGSITKVFTALAIFDLADRGVVDLDRPVGAYLPKAAEPMASATIKQILQHRSGMIEYCGSDERTVTKDDLLRRCMGAKLEAKRAQDIHYSNPAFSVLAALVEEVSGESVDAYVQRRITGPLGMKNTSYGLANPALDEVARTYVNGKSIDAFDASAADGRHWQVYGNGGIVSSADDMLRLYRALSTGDGLSPGVRDLATHLPKGSERPKGEYFGLGMRADPNGRVEVAAHKGSNGYFLSSFYWRPQDRLFAYVHGNNGEDAVEPIVKKLRAAIDSARGSTTGPNDR